VSRKLTRLLLVGAMAAGFVVSPMLDAYAGGPGIDVANNQFGDGQDVTAPLNEAVTWHINDGTHTVSPDPDRGGSKWPVKASGDLVAPTDFAVTFKAVGNYYYKCEKHPDMKGTILVRDPNATTTTTTAAPTTTTTVAPTPNTLPGPTTTTTAAPASSQGTKPPVTAAPAPTTTTAKDKKGKDDKKDETTTTTVPPPPPPVDIPDSAIIPVLPSGATGTTTQNGISAPAGTPEGDAIALLKSKKNGNGKAVKLLIVCGLGLGALGVGTAGYKYANRSSKYFPA